jgi:adenylate cyclase
MTAIYASGQYRLDVAAGILFRGAEPVALGRCAVALLQVLVEGAGNPISKDRLIESGWPGLAIEESSLAVQISALRRVFAEEPGGDSWIETLPRRGYRYVGPVAVKEQENQGATGNEQPTLALPDKPSLARRRSVRTRAAGLWRRCGGGSWSRIRHASARAPVDFDSPFYPG